jgi:hypothetical protein
MFFAEKSPAIFPLFMNSSIFSGQTMPCTQIGKGGKFHAGEKPRAEPEECPEGAHGAEEPEDRP